jgi:hypothetical protein
MGQSLRNILDYIEAGEKKYKINTDFKIWIEIEHLIFDIQKSDEEKFAKILCLAYPILPPDPVAAAKGIFWFYSAGDDKGQDAATKKIIPMYDLTEDYDYVWGAFLSEFGIDLTSVDMHWWKFRTLLACLSDKSKFSKIVGYRAIDTGKIKDKETRRFYEQMKKKFRLAAWNLDLFKEERLAEGLEDFF